jgi:hypothetical protein
MVKATEGEKAGWSLLGQRGKKATFVAGMPEGIPDR